MRAKFVYGIMPYMKIFAISDLHLSINNPKPMDIFGGAWENYLEKIVKNWKKAVLDEDVVLIAGDISWAMNFENAKPDLEFLHTLPGKKIMIRGNHDYWWKSITQMRRAFPPTVMAVQNDFIRINNLLVCGTRGWTVADEQSTDEDKKIFNREIERLKLTLAATQKERREGDTVICMMHFPPFDAMRRKSAFTELISQNNIDAVVYGHLHGKAVRADRVVTIDGIPYYLTACDQIDNNPVLIAEI